MSDKPFMEWAARKADQAWLDLERERDEARKAARVWERAAVASEGKVMEVETERDRLRELLTEFMNAVATLHDDDLGWYVDERDGETTWFIRDELLEKGRDALAREDEIQLTPEDGKRVAESLRNPPEPNDALRDLMHGRLDTEDDNE